MRNGGRNQKGAFGFPFLARLHINAPMQIRTKTMSDMTRINAVNNTSPIPIMILPPLQSVWIKGFYPVARIEHHRRATLCEEYARIGKWRLTNNLRMLCDSMGSMK